MRHHCGKSDKADAQRKCPAIHIAGHLTEIIININIKVLRALSRGTPMKRSLTKTKVEDKKDNKGFARVKNV